MDDLFKEEYLNDYKETADVLNYIYLRSYENIACKPTIKVLEDNLIVGIVTNANQFIPVKPVQDTFNDNLIVKKNKNYMNVDMNITSEKVDNDRAMYVKKINLENEFYNVFRNTIHIILSEFKNRKKREEIERIIYSPTKLYISKMREIERLINVLTENVFRFEDYSDELLLKLGDITTCYNAANKDKECNSSVYCIKTLDGTCSLKIPKINLINEKDNEKLYYGRISDEIIRYNRIRSFMFQPKSFISFSELPYKLNNNEIILLQSLITENKNYFDDIEEETSNLYVKYNTYDTAQPRAGKYYNNIFEFEKQIHDDEEEENIECEVTEASVYGRLKNIFKNCKELTYINSDSICSFNLVFDLIKKVHPTMTLNVSIIKNILLDVYLGKYKKYKNRILDILHNEGKQNITKQIKIGQVTFEYMIMSDNYYISNLDVWVLAEHYKLPIVFLASTKLKENNEDLLRIYGDKDGSFMFIKTPIFTRNINTNYDIIPHYKWIIDSDNNRSLRIELQTLQDKINNNHMTLHEYITNDNQVLM